MQNCKHNRQKQISEVATNPFKHLSQLKEKNGRGIKDSAGHRATYRPAKEEWPVRGDLESRLPLRRSLSISATLTLTLNKIYISKNFETVPETEATLDAMEIYSGIFL